MWIPLLLWANDAFVIITNICNDTNSLKNVFMLFKNGHIFLYQFVLFLRSSSVGNATTKAGVKRDQAKPEFRSAHSIAAIVSSSFMMNPFPDTIRRNKIAYRNMILYVRWNCL